MSIINYEELLQTRRELIAETDKLKAQIAEIDETIKATLPQSDKPYTFGIYKVWWKITKSMRPNMDYIKQHAPTFYANSLEEKTSTYYKIV